MLSLSIDIDFDIGDTAYYVYVKEWIERCKCGEDCSGSILRKESPVVEKVRIEYISIYGGYSCDHGVDLSHQVYIGAGLDNDWYCRLEYLFKTREEAEANLNNESVWQVHC